MRIFDACTIDGKEQLASQQLILNTLFFFKMESFTYNSSSIRVVFGSGSINKTPDELKRLGASRPLLLSTPEQEKHAKGLQEILAGHFEVAEIFPRATMHTPVAVTMEALEFVKSRVADSLVSIGGGSTIGLGKALSIRTGLHHIAIPTTYAGSEVTPILGETEDGRKSTRSNPKILPGTVIYDVDLMTSLPISLSATSGINAIAHAIEALYSPDRNPIIDLVALEGIRALAASLPDVVKDPQDIKARSQALYGAWLSSFDLPHAETHTIVLPHALAFNTPEVYEAAQKLSVALPDSNGDALEGLKNLLKRLPVPKGLKELGMRAEDIDKAADIAVNNPYQNPREIKREPIRELIRRAWEGEDAKVDL
ncbi:maleylacetate reductase [Diaporthe amygdali]|uniref:maleylacetate reductase n=1 Tax=Phomopsis amygdali TaxID=1214568 RepID=UPI0022FE7BEF|nr:maleylacetate reductase [Diaporthe amygdali]KAJ0108262.1 maleylacetate reductase [Diaporthe amygdali]